MQNNALSWTILASYAPGFKIINTRIICAVAVMFGWVWQSTINKHDDDDDERTDTKSVTV